MKIHVSRPLPVAMAALCLTPVLVQAQVVSKPASALEEVVVTAQKRTENMQTVPIAVTALTASDLSKTGTANAQDLNEVVAGLNIQRSGQDTQLKLRGVGTENQGVGDEANVAVYVDGVYQPISKGDNFRFTDIERVEVLKGPQGTLFGRNATGGLINIVTRMPSLTESRADVSASYSRFNTSEYNAYVSGPLSTSMAGGIAGYYTRSDGYLKDPNKRGTHISQSEAYGARGKLRIEPSETVHLIFALDAGYSSDPSPYQPTIVDNSHAFSAFAGAPGFVLSSRPYESATSFTPINEVKGFGGSLQATINADRFDLISVTGVRQSSNHARPDADISPFDVAYIDFTERLHTASEDLRLQSSDPAAKLKWTGGIFAYWAKDKWEDFTLNYGSFVPFGPAVGYVLQPEVETKALAAYGQISYDFNEKLTLILGGRYSYERKEDSVTAQQSGVLFPYPPQNGEASFNDFAPKVTLQYTIVPGTMVYAGYSRGFKSGLLNPLEVQNTEDDGVTPRPQDATKVIKPETIDAYEVGLKTDITENLRTNISAFLYKYKDLQNQFIIPNSSGNKIENVGEATIKGVDADVIAAFAGVISSNDRLSVKVALAYLDAKYDSYEGASVYYYDGPGMGLRPNTAADAADASGNTMTRSPEWTESLTLDYSRDTPIGNIGLTTNVYHSDSFFYDAANTERYAHPAFTKVNAALNWQSVDQHLSASLWGKNLTNEETFQQTYTISLAEARRYYAPRTYGLTVGYSF